MALVIGFFVGRQEILRRGIPIKVYYIYWLSAVPAALILAALNSALFHQRLLEVLSHPARITSSGLVSFGAVIGTLGLGWVTARLYKLKEPEILDVISILLPLILGVYRIGCILNGCCYGRETNGMFGVYLPNLSGNWSRRYPTQIALLVFDFALFTFLWNWRLKKPPAGKTTLIFLLSFSIFRLLLDSLRVVPMVTDWLNILQMGSITLLLLTFYVWFMIRFKKTD